MRVLGGVAHWHVCAVSPLTSDRLAPPPPLAWLIPSCQVDGGLDLFQRIEIQIALWYLQTPHMVVWPPSNSSHGGLADPYWWCSRNGCLSTLRGHPRQPLHRRFQEQLVALLSPDTELGTRHQGCCWRELCAPFLELWVKAGCARFWLGSPYCQGHHGQRHGLPPKIFGTLPGLERSTENTWRSALRIAWQHSWQLQHFAGDILEKICLNPFCIAPRHLSQTWSCSCRVYSKKWWALPLKVASYHYHHQSEAPRHSHLRKRLGEAPENPWLRFAPMHLDELSKNGCNTKILFQLFFLPQHDAAIIVPSAVNIYVEGWNVRYYTLWKKFVTTGSASEPAWQWYISILASKPASGSFMHVDLLPNTSLQTHIRSPKKIRKITHGETSVSWRSVLWHPVKVCLIHWRSAGTPFTKQSNFSSHTYRWLGVVNRGGSRSLISLSRWTSKSSHCNWRWRAWTMTLDRKHALRHKKLGNKLQTRDRGMKIFLLSCSGRNSTLTDLQHIVQHQEPQNGNLTLQSTADWLVDAIEDPLIQENDRYYLIIYRFWWCLNGSCSQNNKSHYWPRNIVVRVWPGGLPPPSRRT